MTSSPLPLLSRPAAVPRPVVLRLRAWVRAVLDLPEDTAVAVTQRACPDRACVPVVTVLTVLTVLHPGAPLTRTLPLAADRVCAADVLAAFDRREQS